MRGSLGVDSLGPFHYRPLPNLSGFTIPLTQLRQKIYSNGDMIWGGGYNGKDLQVVRQYHHELHVLHVLSLGGEGERLSKVCLFQTLSPREVCGQGQMEGEVQEEGGSVEQRRERAESQLQTSC